ncbi:MAG: hypothetical protein NT169_05155 [Chloroflexi bacterium]|nr:hypothetical protein [Chloroflexota bacterium]
MPYPQFDRTRLRVKPLAERTHDMTLAEVLPLDYPGEPCPDPALPLIAERIVHARQIGAPVILLMGAHVIKTGLSRFVIDLMTRGLVTLVGMNGAGPIHDYELALIGATTESVARYIQEGQFGLWQETGEINAIVAEGVRDGLGYGEAVGRAIQETGEQRIEADKRMIAQEAGGRGQAIRNPQSAICNLPFPHADISILAAGYRLRVPVTVHIGIGYDIIHEHPNCDAAALGEASYRDFLIFAQAITQLQGGVLLNFGTAVMGPEVYLKALSMARNVAQQEGRRINEFTTAVFDLQDLGSDLRHEAPKSDARYYYRPFKTILVRTVQDGGESFYVRGAHQATLPALYRLLTATISQ